MEVVTCTAFTAEHMILVKDRFEEIVIWAWTWPCLFFPAVVMSGKYVYVYVYMCMHIVFLDYFILDDWKFKVHSFT